MSAPITHEPSPIAGAARLRTHSRLYGEIGAAVASGALLGAAFPSLNWSWAAWFALVPLWLIVARGRGAWRTFGLGYLSGAVFFAVSCPWIATTIHNFGSLSWTVALIVFVLFLALMGSYLALFAVVGYGLGRWVGDRLLPLPFLWVAVEWLRTYTPMGGFPWNLLGYSQVQHAGFMRVVSVGGIYAASLLLAIANTLLAYLCWRGWLRWQRRRAGSEPVAPASRGRTAVLVAVIAALAALLIFAAWPYAPPALPASTLPLEARLVQPNTSLNATWTPESLQRFLDEQLQLSLAPQGSQPGTGRAAAQLIVWPEQPAPLNYALEPAFQRMTAALQAQTGAAFLFGEVTYPTTAQGAPDYNQPRNSSRLILPNGMTGPRYDKLHLVPFGEYVPLPGWLQRLAGVSKLVQGVGNFVPGNHRQLFPLGVPGNGAVHRFATMICYESIFPALARHNVADGAEWLVNQSDDSWYGHSSAAAQGLMMARVRAMENHRWLLRDTDDGITAVVDPYGRVRAQLPRQTAAALDARFAPLSQLTFYTRHGDWLPLLCTVIIGLLALWAWLRPKPAPSLPPARTDTPAHA